MRNADLIIGHAGAGTCMEALSYAKPLLTVVNNKLLHNHQLELAERLAQGRYCLVAHSPADIDTTLKDPRLLSPSPFPSPVKDSSFTTFIDQVMNFA